MKLFKTITLFIFLFFVSKIHAQQTYLAVYKYGIPNAVKDIKGLIKDNGMGYNTHYDPHDTSIAAKKFVTEFTKWDYNNNVLLPCYCNAMCNKIVFSLKGSSVQPLPAATIHNKSRNDAFTIINYINYTLSSCNGTDTQQLKKCQRIDTAKLYFKPSGKTKKINKWFCKQYIPVDTSIHDFSIWVSAAVPSFVNPGIFMINAKGGIVCAQYKNIQLYLSTLQAVNDNILPANCTETVTKQTEIIGGMIALLRYAGQEK